MSNEYNAWPFQEARKILERIDRDGNNEKVTLQTGYGPSGLPHVGTFSEMARTTWVRYALEHLADVETELVVFSDDMDGLRKVPENIPNEQMLRENLGKPLCDIPDPFGEHDSFSAYMNQKLISFLDSFDFDYRFVSSKDQYRDGTFNDGLDHILQNYEQIRDVIVPTLREQNRADWSPFFPICQNCGKIYTTQVTDISKDDGTVSYRCSQNFRGIADCGHAGTVPVTDGHIKVGWKVDWALRWYVFDVDYEMYGKDLIESADLSSTIVEKLGGRPPAGLFYEMFLDENGQKISKSVGKGLTIDEWRKYAPLDSLAWFIYQSPQKAKKFYHEMIPRSTDKYLGARHEYTELSEQQKPDSPIWFLHHDQRDDAEAVGYQSEVVNYSMLLNLVSVLNAEDPKIIWDYVERYDPEVSRDRDTISRLIDGAMAYCRDFILPEREYKVPDEQIMPGLTQFRDFLRDADPDVDAETIQNAAYRAGKENDISLGKWFKSMYQLLLGQDHGPRLGTFVHFYGVNNTLEHIDERLSGDSELEE